MKPLLALTMLTATVLPAATGEPGAVYVNHERVEAARTKGGGLGSGSGISAAVGHRDKVSGVDLHDTDAEVLYVLEGEANFVSGGTMVDGNKGIEGGTVQHLGTGDLVVVLPGTPHWFKEIIQPISYLAVKITKPTASPGIVYVNHESVEAALVKGGSLAKAPGVLAAVGHRDKPAGAEIHDTDTEMLYPLSGEVTFVSGGAIIGAKGANQPSEIQGGTTQHLSKGDLVVLPPETPHWMREVFQPVSYLAVKISTQ
jgi:quercetin dioxygenase-like cupin family protein